MKTFLFLGSSKGTTDLVRYARSRGYYTVVADNTPFEKSIPKQMANEYWMVSTADIDELERRCRERSVIGVACGITEFNLQQQMELCKRLNLPCHITPEAWHYSIDKADFKHLCKQMNVPVPKDYNVSYEPTEEEIKEIDFPVMVKPVDCCSNRGISYCYSADEFHAAVKKAHAASDKRKMIVEHMIKGEEWYASYALADGHISLIALNAMYSQPGEPKNCYTITTTVSAYIRQFLEEINDKIINLLKAVGCTNGYAWVQVMRDTDGKFYVIEMGHRLDGDMMYIPCKDICGFDTVKYLVDYACGLRPGKDCLPAPQHGPFTKCATAIMFWTNKTGIISEVSGVEKVAKLPGVYIDGLPQVGDSIGMYDVIGNVMFTSDDVESMCEMITYVNDNISIKNERGEDVIIRFTDFNRLKNIYYTLLREN